MSRLTNDVENINLVLADSVTQLVSGVLSMVGVAAAMFWLNPLAGADQPAVDPADDAALNRWVAPRTRDGFREPAGRARHAERPDRGDRSPASGSSRPTAASRW